MGASGTTEIDFGAFPGNTHTTVAVTGQGGIVAASSLVEAWVQPAITTDHSSDEHVVAVGVGLRVVAADLVDGVGFTIHGTYQAPLDEPLAVVGPAGLRAAATSIFGDSRNSVGGAVLRAYGKFKVAWVWL